MSSDLSPKRVLLQPLERRSGSRAPQAWPGPSHEPDFRAVASMLRRRRWPIVLSTISVFGLVTAFTYFSPKTYESSATFLIDKQGQLESPALDVLQRLGAGGQIWTEMNLLDSRSVVEPVVDDLNLQVAVSVRGREERPSDVFRDFEVGHDAPAGEYRITQASPTSFDVYRGRHDSLIAVVSSDSVTHFAGLALRLPDSPPVGDVFIRVASFPQVVAALQQRVTASPVHREADLISLTCRGETAPSAQSLCEGISRSYMRLRTDLQRQDAAGTAGFLREQVARLNDQLTATEDTLETYTRTHQVVALEEQASHETQQYIDVRAQRDQLEGEWEALNSLIRAIESQPGGSTRYRDLAGFPTLLKNDAVTALLASLVEVENRRVEVASRRTEQNADLSAIDTRIADLEQQLHGIATSYQQSRALEIKSLDTTLARMSNRLATIPGEQVTIARLQRQETGIEDVHRMLATRLREAEVAEAIRLPNVRIVDGASLPYRSASPNVRFNLGLGLIGGLAVGLALAVLQEFRDSSLHERGEVEFAAGLPILAMIPRMQRPGPVLPVSRSSMFWDGRGALMVPERQRPSTQAAQETLITLEAFRALGVDLKFAGRHLNNGALKSIAVMSAARGEGKTLTACNLAVTRARHGVRTLLVDADMRACGVSAFFELPAPKYGLSDLLAGSVEVGGACTQLCVDGREMLSLIPAGTPTPHSGLLLESPNMELLLKRSRDQFDLLVVDTPPLNAITDGATIAGLVDGIILVVRSGMTDRNELELALERLSRSGGRVLGVVFNDAPLPSGYLNRYAYLKAAPVSS